MKDKDKTKEQLINELELHQRNTEFGESEAYLKRMEEAYEITFVKKDGTPVYVIASSVVHRDKEGKILRLEGFFKDITERRWAEEELRKYRDHLEELVEERTVELRMANEKLQREITKRKQTEEKLSRMSNAVMMSSDSIVISDLEGKIIEVNEATLKMYGTDDKECLIGKSSFDLIVPEEREKAFAGMEEVLEKGYIEGREYHVIGKDGSKIPVEMSVAIMKDMNGKPIGFVGITRDITRRKHTREQILKQSAMLDAINKVFLETLMCETDEEVARTCLFVAEELTKSKFGFICEVNQAGRFNTIAISDSGWEACRILKTNAALTLNDLEIRGIRGRVVKDGRAMIFNDPASHPDWVGTPEGHPRITCFLGVPLKHASRTIGMIGLANKESGYSLADQQVAETLSIAFVEALNRKRAEMALKESEERFKKLADLLPQTVFEIDLEGNFLYANRHGFDSSGYTQDDLDKGLNALQLFTPEDRDRVLENIKRVLKGEKSGGNEYTVQRKDGSRFPVIVYSTPIIHGKKPVGLRGIIIDITKRKQTEENIKASLKEKEILLKEIHHRVKNNLQIICSLLDLQADFVEDEQALGIFNESKNRIRTMALVHEYLYQSQNLARIDFTEYIRNLASYLFRSYEVDPDAIQLRINVKDDISLSIDKAIPCGLILNELLSNSLKYAFPEGREGEITIDLRLKNDKHTLIVSDNGVGFPKDLDFRNTESLGLQLVVDLTEQIDGSIELRRNGGTKFLITFP